jgi:type IV pilus assembly protein PilE
MKNKDGLSLIELIVAIAIVTLLAIIGLPSYQTYLVEARRNDAINTLRQNQLTVENYKYQYGILPTSGQVTLITTSPQEYYTITYNRVDDDNYTLVATAVNGKSQANDTGCTIITLMSQMSDIYPADCH